MKTEWRFSAHPIGIACVAAALLFVPVEQLSAALIAILLHEAAHLVCIRLCGVQRCSVEWTPLGFVAKTERLTSLPVMHQLWIAGSGLLASAGMAIAVYPLAAENRFLYYLFTANLAILLINSLPILPLDGGKVLLALAALAGWENGIKRILLFLSYFVSVLVTGLGLYGAMNGVLNPTLLLMGPYLAYAAKQSSLASGTEAVQMLQQRSQCRKDEIRKAEIWTVTGEMTPRLLMKAFQQSPRETFVLFHTIDPDNGRLIATETQQQMIEKLVDNK
ncbi:MAG: hypothetical protein E7323_05550 [Clostridiales bacterium]|nr:hypothetical protein [Clostridiales bacterium]